MFASWRSVYDSDVQGLYALVVVPALFLPWLLAASPPIGRAVEPRAARHVWWWAVVFTVETILDPLVTGTLPRALGVGAGPLADYVMVPFVLLGDLRVFLLLFLVLAPDRALARTVARAAAWTLVVPAATVTVRVVAGALPGTITWLVYELLFMLLAVYVRARIVPRGAGDRPPVRAYLRAVLAYVAVYYALWAAADVLILAGAEAGWGLRIVPNQLYYAWWVPFAYVRFSARREPRGTGALH